MSGTLAFDLALPTPRLPSDGGADIFRVGARLFATDRFRGNGVLYELTSTERGRARGRLAVRASVELGVHPRFTGALGSSDTIYSVSRDDGRVTFIDVATLAVRAQRPAFVAQPCFLARCSAALSARDEDVV